VAWGRGHRRLVIPTVRKEHGDILDEITTGRKDQVKSPVLTNWNRVGRQFF
jgi:hypothetical protein